ncbi:hypothetical protein NDU88_000680 [Pleurodeles waltl]|uniref:Uncharacterized protein n=1 Tax=Pleurodeles waltl TaxID=8319 RepID=A0AAV7P201_PLEWA|nr:hypothetical protein NDU88_000680 [Pleurodeles waltl]
MPRGKATGKPPGNTVRQLLFSEALRQQKHPPVKDPKGPPPHCHTITGNMEESPQGASMDRILQEISAVGRKLEGMDSAMMALTAETRSMRLEIAGFQSQILGLDQRVATVETQVASWTDNGQELMHLRSKLMDLEDRSRRNNIRLMGLPEGMEGTDLTSFLRDTLPKLTDITWITKNGDSRTFFDPEDLRTFLDKIQEQAHPMETTTLPLQDIRGTPSETSHPEAIFNPERGTTMDPQTQGKRLVETRKKP